MAGTGGWQKVDHSWSNKIQPETNREKLDSIPLKEIEQYLREKKLEKLKK